ncbi:amino acid permease [Criblamydia sequanensis]|uniref:Tryptophan/tyrosine permease n=1 Tax=Candidatus Criblamydia sequanensis CRIB-18 TaxID=1437425 RepID=A0A090DWE3_9BACT|nr:aromatic amino acid transport family protein [Criblamydia sequanensis]CDR33209.1 Tryptophan/tyrosine permease [Criblamydia sequanensis CRIB-18]
MYKQFGAILLVAGTCIGSGMIALPLVLAKLGLIPSILLMVMIWFIMYYTSLVHLELNLQAGHGLSLGALGRYFSGRTAELIGTISLKLLSYSLLAVFIYGGSSILKELIASKMVVEYSFNNIATCYTLLSITLLLLPIKLIDYLNRFLFVSLLTVVAILLAGIVITINWSELPLFSEQHSDLSVWMAIIPVAFTSFGFQVIFHTLTNYCHKNVKMLKQAFLWGSLIPAIVYIVWTCSILSVVYQDNPQFYDQMAGGKAEVGELIQVLSGIAKWQSVQLLVWWISMLAIATSVLGVGLGLCDSIKGMLSKKVPNTAIRNILASIITILPAYLVVMYVPNAFITVLGFAGMILAVIAILLPVYLFWQIKGGQLYYSELNRKYLLHFSVVVAMTVIICEIFNML